MTAIRIDRWTFAVCLGACLVCGGARGAAWEHVGPYGGLIIAIAIAPATGVLHATTGTAVPGGAIVLRSTDQGATWIPRVLPAPCQYVVALAVRADGHVLVDCGNDVLRSPDGLDGWTVFDAPEVRGTVYADPANPRRAVQRAIHTVPFGAGLDALYVTDDDGAHWSLADSGVFPYALAFDRGRAGRLVGLTRPYPIAYGYEYVHESFDGGRTWRFVSTIDTAGCDGNGTLLSDAAGTLFRASACGVLRSNNGGQAWQALGMPAGGQAALRAVDSSRAGVVLAGGFDGTWWRSTNAGDTWAAMATPPNPAYAAAIGEGVAWIGTTQGAFRYDEATRTWVARSRGIEALRTSAAEPTAAGPLLVLDAVVRISEDDGGTWTEVRVDGEPLVALFPNASARSEFLAYTKTYRLVRSSNGGRTWVEVAPSSTAEGGAPTYRELVPTGIDSRVLYATRWEYVPGSFGGCCVIATDVVRSDDGGRTFTRLMAPAGQGVRAFVGVASPLVVFASGTVGTYRSRDGGTSWQLLPRAGGYGTVFVPDPAMPERWYATQAGGRIATTDDAGDTWSDISLPYAASGELDLLVDPVDTQRLTLVHADGGMSRSDDRGQRWRRVVSPTRDRVLLPGTARLAPGDPQTIYAGAEQGALRIVVASAAAPVPVRAVEYARIGGAIEHYFITADPGEMARLDRPSLEPIPFARTGYEFDVWPSGTAPPAGTSPVCRFYGLPEKGLDSHFFSVSPAECDAVRQRFADSWIFETSDAFVAGVPDAAGTCPETMRPLFRVYNDRSDANHRYTTERTVRDAMAARGWIAEGYGPDAVAMCVPGDAAVAAIPRPAAATARPAATR